MTGLAELAAVMMDAAQRRIEVTANNISNLNTPGFRARRAFQRVVDDRLAMPALAVALARSSGRPGLKVTGNPFDIAVAGDAMLLLRSGDRLDPASSVQLRRDAEGRLVDNAGRVLQAAGGGDVVIGQGAPTILQDGTVLLGGQPEARIGLFAGDIGGARFDQTGGALPPPADGAVLHQGMVVPSDVDLGAEMVELTVAGRMAETGARIFQISDELLGKATSLLGDVRR